MSGDPTTPRTGRPRRLLAWALGLVALVAATLFVGTRPAVLARLLLPAVSRAVGGTVRADRVALESVDTLVIENLAIRANGWRGAAAEVAGADRIELRFSPWALLTGDLEARSIRIGRLDLRVAERIDQPGDFSLLALTPEQSEDASPSAPARFPQITVEELEIENGFAFGNDYAKQGSLRFRGTLGGGSDGPDSIAFRLSGRPDDDGHVAISAIDGRYDAKTRALSLELDELEVAGGSLAVAPISVRAWAQRLGLEGRVSRARLDYAPGAEPAAELDVEGVAMSLPVELLGAEKLGDLWAGLSDGKLVEARSVPRMTIESGVLRLVGDQVRLERLRGRLGASDAGAGVLSVPFECAFTLDIPTKDLPPFDWDRRDDWFAKAAELAPFSLTIDIDGFASPAPTPGDPKVLQLPRAAARALADFNITSWTLEIETRFERAPATKGASGAERAKIVSSGTLRLRNGSGAFKEFPYRLDDVAATISFRDDNVVVERLTGRGADEATVLIEGKLDGIASGALIDLRVTCPEAPIDDRLFGSFEEGPRKALQLLFDAGAARNLAAAGLLPDEAALIEQRQELARLGSDDSVADKRARLSRSVEAGPFRLGGRCAFDIRIYSPAGFGQPVLVTGAVEVRDAGLMFGRFPYPLRLRQGTFNVLDEAIVIGGGGLKATTPAGGELTVSGSVQIPRDGKGGRGLNPLIAISDRNDALNPALLAAIPFDERGAGAPAAWPGAALSPAGELLDALGLSGDLELNGIVRAGADGGEDFEVRLAFADGTAAPDEQGRAWLDKNGLPWPPDFVLDDCSARLNITSERVEIEQCTGRRGRGSVVARGFARLDGPERDVRLEFVDLPIDRSFEGYLAADPSAAAKRFASLGPSGELRGFVERTVDAHGERTRGTLEPRFIEVTIDGARVRADSLGGRIAVDGSQLRAESLEFRLSSGSVDEGLLRISGPLGRGLGSREAPFEVSIANGRFESSLVRAALDDRAPVAAELLRELNARGAFDARYSRGDAEAFELTPRTLSIGPRNDPLDMAFADEDRVTATDAKVEAVLHGDLAAPNAGTMAIELEIALDAALDPRDAGSSSATVLDGTFALDAAALTSPIRRHLPPPFDTAAAAVELVSNGRFELKLDSVHAEWPAATPTTPSTAPATTTAPATAPASTSTAPATAASTTGSITASTSSTSGAGPTDREPAVYSLRGTLRADDATLRAGELFTKTTLAMPFSFDYRPKGPRPIDFRAEIDAQTTEVFGCNPQRVDATIASTELGRGLRVEAAGDLYGGRVEALATVDFDADRYDLRVRTSDVDFDRLRDRTLPAGRGKLSSTMRVAGPSGGTPEATAARRGVGRVAIRNATLASMPVALRVLQLTQFLPPVDSTLTESDADFTIRGDTAECSDFRLACGTLTLEGEGTVDIPTFGLAMRLFPKGRIPLFSDLVGGFTNQLFAVDVRGTLAKPEASVAPIPAMTRKPTLTAPTTPAPANGAEPAPDANGAAPAEPPSQPQRSAAKEGPPPARRK